MSWLLPLTGGAPTIWPQLTVVDPMVFTTCATRGCELAERQALVVALHTQVLSLAVEKRDVEGALEGGRFGESMHDVRPSFYDHASEAPLPRLRVCLLQRVRAGKSNGPARSLRVWQRPAASVFEVPHRLAEHVRRLPNTTRGPVLVTARSDSGRCCPGLAALGDRGPGTAVVRG